MQIVPVLRFALRDRVGIGNHDGTLSRPLLIQLLSNDCQVQRWVSILLTIYGAAILVGSRQFCSEAS
jgi:hypothetical protein